MLLYRHIRIDKDGEELDEGQKCRKRDVKRCETIIKCGEGTVANLHSTPSL